MAAEVEGDCCSICLGEYKDPRILPCQHVFCLQCLCDYVAEKKKINCPNCMTKIEIPVGGVAVLLKYVEEPLQKPLHESPEPEACTCNVCENGIEASFQCFECDKCMCDACKKCHDVFSSKHQVHTLQASDSEKSFCENHPEVVLQFYCKNCKCLICQQCMDNDHNSEHIVLGIEDFFTNIKKQFEDYQEKIDEKLRKISEVTDSFISKETKSFHDVMQRVPKLEADFKECKEIVCYRKKSYSENDQILSKKLTAAIKHLDKPLNKSDHIRELLDLTLKLESTIKANHTDINKIGVDMGTLDVTMGRLFSFTWRGLSLEESKVFFVGGIHWTISVTTLTEEYDRDRHETSLTLNSFIKEEDKQLVDSVTADLVFTLILNTKMPRLTKKQSDTFSPVNSFGCNTRLHCKLLHFSTIARHHKSLEIWFDIKEIKYKNNLKKRQLCT